MSHDHDWLHWPINLDPLTLQGAANLTALAFIGAAATYRQPQLTSQQEQWLKDGCCLRCGRPDVRPIWREPNADDQAVCSSCLMVNGWKDDVLSGRTETHTPTGSSDWFNTLVRESLTPCVNCGQPYEAHLHDPILRRWSCPTGVTNYQAS